MSEKYRPNGIELKVWRQHCVNQGVNLPEVNSRRIRMVGHRSIPLFIH